MSTNPNLFRSTPAKFAARRIAEVESAGRVPESIVSGTTRKLIIWLEQSRIGAIEVRMKELVEAMRRFPASAALRIMAAINERNPTIMKRAFEQDALLQSRIEFFNRALFIDHAFSPVRVQRISKTSRAYIERYGIASDE